MRSTTSATDPVSYYEALSAFWAAARTACGTDLRGQSLVNLDVLGPVPHGFIVELGSKLRPACIEHGLCQAGSGKPTRIDVPNADAPVLPHEPGGQLMLEAQVDADLAGPMLPILRNLDLQIQMPAAAGVLSEAATAKLTVERPAEPEPISALERQGFRRGDVR